VTSHAKSRTRSSARAYIGTHTRQSHARRYATRDHATNSTKSHTIERGEGEDKAGVGER
jgi:hypothetical protein